MKWSGWADDQCLQRVIGILTLVALSVGTQSPAVSVVASVETPESPSAVSHVVGDELHLRWEVPAFRLLPRLGGDGRYYQALEVPGWFAAAEPGKPQLPYTSALISLPPEGNPRIQVQPSEPETIFLFRSLLPAFGSVGHEMETGGTALNEATWAYDPAAYAADSVPDVPVVTLTEVGIMRGVRLARIQFNPFRYHAASNRLEIVGAVDITVRFEETSPMARSMSGEVTDPILSTLQSLVLNPEVLSQYEAVSEPAHGSSSPRRHAQSGAMEFSLMEPGLYALPLALLQSALGVTGSGDLAKVQVTHGGTEIALQWDEAGQSFLFYVDPQPTRWDDHVVYQLFLGDMPGLRMRSRSGSSGSLDVGTAWAVAFAEENVIYKSKYTSPRDGDHWFWDSLQRGFSESQATMDYQVSLVSPASGGTATLTVWLQGGTDLGPDPDHRVAASVNGTAVGEVTWDGIRPYTATLTLNLNLLNSGANTVTLSLPGLSGVSIERAWVDALSVRYPVTAAVSGNPLCHVIYLPVAARNYASSAGGLAVGRMLDQGTRLQATIEGQPCAPYSNFTGEETAHAYVIDGWDVAALVYDITDPDAPLVITGSTLDGTTLTVGDAGGGTLPRRYYITGAANITAVSDLQAVEELSEPTGADYLVIAPADFLTTLQRLLTHRSAQGLTTFAASVEAIYDVYGDGSMDPEAIRTFVAHAYGAWTPRPAYLLLVGDATRDPLGHLSHGSPTLLPAYLASADPWLGEIPSDNAYVTVDGNDVLPDLAVGRLPANTAAEVAAMVDKIVAYDTNPESGDWASRHLFFADDPDGAGDFHQLADEVSALVPAGHTVQRLYCPDGADDGLDDSHCDSPAALTPSLLSAWNDGALVVNWVGHSSFVQWEHGRLFHTDDVSSLRNRRRLPVVVEMTCYTAHFTDPDPSLSSMDEVLVRLPGAGAVAAWGSSGEGVGTDHQPLHQGFYQTIFGGARVRLGEAVMAAKTAVAGGVGEYLVESYHLFGDPAMFLNPDPAS